MTNPSASLRIFATVGTQGAFDRLVRAVDTWAATQDPREVEVFAQIGPDATAPENCLWERDLEPIEFRERFESATHIVAHAGCGTILSALELGKPIVVMPRRAEFGEHRNDHQVATAERFAQRALVRVAWDERELAHALEDLDAWHGGEPISARASEELISVVRAFLSQRDP